MGEQQRTDWDRSKGPWLHSENVRIVGTFRAPTLCAGVAQALSTTQAGIQARGRHLIQALRRAPILAQGIPGTQALHKVLIQAQGRLLRIQVLDTVPKDKLAQIQAQDVDSLCQSGAVLRTIDGRRSPKLCCTAGTALGLFGR